MGSSPVGGVFFTPIVSGAKMEKKLVKDIPKKRENISKWYISVIRKADLVDYAPVKGMMVIKPSGYAIWENIQKILDSKFKETGHQNAYFPLLIPESFLNKEAEHVEGFSPEVAWVTIGGSEELEERLAIRPTSESIICAMYSKWIMSWRDLPVLINQWANVLRWEKVTKPFLRTSEFLWQEGHTAHKDKKEAIEETLKIINIYKDFIENYLAIPVIMGQKSDKEKFAGADITYSVEALMPDGKALQAGTSHYLGDNFSKAFNIRFEDKDNKLKFVHQTSWGVSTRLIGGLVLTHGDDSGLIIPPEVAQFQTIIIPITRGDWKETILPMARDINKKLMNSGIRSYIDEREEYTPGWKFSEWEMRGVPLRIEIGPKDIEKKQVVLVSRVDREKRFVPVEKLEEETKKFLKDIQNQLFQKAKKFADENTHYTEDMKTFKEYMKEGRGFIKAPWCGDEKCEMKIKEETTATIRTVGDKAESGNKCIVCGKEAEYIPYFAKSY